MKLGKLSLILAAFIVTVGLQPAAAWATRVLGVTVSGAITASPSPTQIEIAHKVYHILANSPAAKAARSFSLGQVVDAVLSGPAVNQEPEVVSLVLHSGG
jgi:hypothetical protein